MLWICRGVRSADDNKNFFTHFFFCFSYEINCLKGVVFVCRISARYTDYVWLKIFYLFFDVLGKQAYFYSVVVYDSLFFIINRAVKYLYLESFFLEFCSHVEKSKGEL